MIVISNFVLSASGKYCLKDIEWRTGSTCKVLGTIVSIGSECSVFTILLLSVFRLSSVLRYTMLKK